MKKYILTIGFFFFINLVVPASGISNKGVEKKQSEILQYELPGDKKKKHQYGSGVKDKRKKKLKRRKSRRTYGSKSRNYSGRYNPFDFD